MAEPQIPATVVTKREGTSSVVVGTGDGGVMQVVAMPWWQVIGVRSLRVFFQSFMGFFTLSSTGVVQMANGASGGLANVKLAFYAAGAAALFTAGQNIVELLIKLDVNRPTWRG